MYVQGASTRKVKAISINLEGRRNVLARFLLPTL